MLDILLIELVPDFEQHWRHEEVYREDDGAFTSHGIMGSFLEFYQSNYETLSSIEISRFCIEFEKIVSLGPDDSDLVANAICTMFLELLVNTEAGNRIEPLLGKSCKEFWNRYKF